MESKAYDRLVIELQKDGEAVASVSIDTREIGFLEGVRDIPMREHIVNMVEAVVGAAEKKAAAGEAV